MAWYVALPYGPGVNDDQPDRMIVGTGEPWASPASVPVAQSGLQPGDCHSPWVGVQDSGWWGGASEVAQAPCHTHSSTEVSRDRSLPAHFLLLCCLLCLHGIRIAPRPRPHPSLSLSTAACLQHREVRALRRAEGPALRGVGGYGTRRWL